MERTFTSVSRLFVLTPARPVSIAICKSGGVYTIYQVGTNLSVAIKQMDLDKQPKRDLIINEILIMHSSRYLNITNYIDSFL